MFRRIVLAAALAVGVLSVTQSPPAAAAVACFTQGVLHTSPPLNSSSSTTASFSYSGSVNAGCASVSMGGTLTGTCLLLTGNGNVAIDGRSYNFILDAVAGVVAFRGEVIGAGYMGADWTRGDSCISGADDFILTAVLSPIQRGTAA